MHYVQDVIIQFKNINNMDVNLTNLIKNNTVAFDSFRAGIFYYVIGEPGTTNEYLFQVPLHDIGTATLLATDKAIYFMRWIRKSIEDGTLTPVDLK